jgi:hypothetical protein
MQHTVIVDRGSAVDRKRHLISSHDTYEIALTTLKRFIRRLNKERAAEERDNYGGPIPLIRIEKGYYSEAIDDHFYPNLHA